MSTCSTVYAKDGYTRHFEVMAQIADGMFKDMEQLQDKVTEGAR